jgi:peptidoglycan/LPS O-acetylase OafA/YrhL
VDSKIAIRSAYSQQRFASLDGLRGIAALCVVGHHLNVVGGFTEWNFFGNSYLFVELFFVLSGFVIAHGYAYRPKFEVRQFFVLRSFRLFPLHVVMLLVVLALELGKWAAWQYGVALNNEPFSGRNALEEFLPNLLLLQAWWPSFYTVSFNFPSWSISVEYYVYLIFAATLFSAGRFKLLFWFLLFSLGIYWMTFSDRPIPHPVARGLQGFFGGALCYFMVRNASAYIKPRWAWLAVVEITVVIAAVWFLAMSLYHKQVPVGWMAMCGLLVVVLSFESGAVSRLLKNAFFSQMGKLSYSIYLTHYPVLLILTSGLLIAQKLLGVVVVPMQDGQRYFDFGSTAVNNVYALAVLGLVVLVSSTTYKYIEQPGLALGRKIAAQRK